MNQDTVGPSTPVQDVPDSNDDRGNEAASENESDND